MSRESYALDTSYVLRFLTFDPHPQYLEAAAFYEEASAAGVRLVVSDLVLAEAYFALQHHYDFPKDEALKALAAFAAKRGIETSASAQALIMQPDLATANPGFVDRLIHGASHAAGHVLVTFEKASRKLPRTRVLRG